VDGYAVGIIDKDMKLHIWVSNI